MVKLLLTSLLLATTLLSNETATQNTQSLEEFSKEKKEKVLEQYTKALNLYKQKKYQEAYDNFNELFESNLDDVNINFYLGRSAFELKKYHDAIIAYDRVLFSKPDNLRTKLEIGRAYFMTKQFKEAKKFFEDIYNNPNTPPKIKNSLTTFFNIIDQNTQKHFLNGVILIGLNYDSNVNNRSSFDTFNIINLPVTNTTEADSAVAHQEVLILNHKYNLGDTSLLKNDLMVFNKSMFKNKHQSKDVKLISYTPAYTKKYKNGLSMDYAVFADKLWIENDGNLQTYGIIPKLTYAYNDKINFNSHFKYQDKNYIKSSDKNKDSKYTEFQFGLKYLATKKITYGASIIASKERKNDSTGPTSVDKDTYQFKLNNTYLYNKSLSFAPAFSYKKTAYKDTDNTYFVKQNDDEYKFTLMGTYIYSPKWLFQLGGDYTKTDSNIDKSVYSKHTFTFNIIRPF